MRRSVFLHTLVLLASLAAAYRVWTKEPSPSDDAVTVLRLRAGVDRVIYRTPGKIVDVERRRDDGGDFTWVTVSRVEQTTPSPEPAPAAPNDASDATDPPADDVITEVTSFKGNETADQMVKTVANLTAIRSLGALDQEALTEFELLERQRTLTLISGSTERLFVLGATTFGSSDVYALDTSAGTGYVLRGSLKQELDYAEMRYLDRRLTAIKDSEMERVALRIAGSEEAPEPIARTMVHHGLHKNLSAAFWTIGETNTPQDACRDWVRKLTQLGVEEYIVDAQTLPPLKKVLELELTGTRRRHEHATIYRKDADSDGGSQYYAQGSHTRTHVKLNRAAADELIRDLGNLLEL